MFFGNIASQSRTFMKLYTQPRGVSMIIRRFSRFFTMICAGLILFLTAMPSTPAFAARSSPQDATVQLDGITAASEDVAKSAPLGEKQVEARSEEGLNEVQGAADADKMVKAAKPDQSGSAMANELTRRIRKDK
jgi:hypothetical protein